MGTFRLLQVSDTHIVADGSGRATSLASAVREISGRTTADALVTVLARVAGTGFDPDLLVHTGDIVDHADTESYGVAARLLAPVGAPVLAVAGNHDEPHLLAASFGEDRVFERDRWQVVLVDTRLGGEDHGAVGGAGLAWLDEHLSSTDAHVVVGLHHPPLSTCGEPACRLTDSHQLLAILDRHPNVRGVLSGHLHWPDEIERQGVRYLLAPSTCLQLRHVHPLAVHNRAPTPIGARILELGDDGRIRTEVVWA